MLPKILKGTAIILPKMLDRVDTPPNTVLFAGIQDCFMPDIQNRCGEQHGRFYDRKGDFFREGVDPRNNFGRKVFVDRHMFRPKNLFPYDVCACGENRFSDIHIVGNLNA